MKYTLKKEIPNCDWKVGEVIEDDGFGSIVKEERVGHWVKSNTVIDPFVLALLVHCGFLEEVKEDYFERVMGNPLENLKNVKVDTSHMDNIKRTPIIFGGGTGVEGKPPYTSMATTQWDKPTINRFTEMPEEGTEYWYHAAGSDVFKDQISPKNRSEIYAYDIYNFKTGNMFKDRASAEAAYQLIMKGE